MRLDDSQPANEIAHSAKGFRFAVVASRWNDSLVSRLVDGALDALKELSADAEAIKIYRVPGSFEIPLCAMKAAQSGKFDAVICLGVIIRGDTPHFDYIAAETSRGINEVGLRTGVPTMFGVMKCPSTVASPIYRTGGNAAWASDGNVSRAAKTRFLLRHSSD